MGTDVFTYPAQQDSYTTGLPESNPKVNGFIMKKNEQVLWSFTLTNDDKFIVISSGEGTSDVATRKVVNDYGFMFRKA